MIKWCGYCLKFLREFEPYHNFDISHGVCHDCLSKVLTLTSSDQEALQPLRDFYRTLQQRVRSGQVEDLPAFLEDSLRLGIRPIDLMMGVLQPMLAEIGELWAQGTLTVGMEHRFSAVARDLTAHFRKQVEPALRGSPPDLLLFSAPNNSHNLGLQMAEFYFAISGIPALVSLTAPSLTEVMELVDLHAPKAVGFSVAMPGQMGPVREMAEAIRNRPGPSPYVLVGGPAVRLGLQGEPASGIHACLDFTDAMAFL